MITRVFSNIAGGEHVAPEALRLLLTDMAAAGSVSRLREVGNRTYLMIASASQGPQRGVSYSGPTWEMELLIRALAIYIQVSQDNLDWLGILPPADRESARTAYRDFAPLIDERQPVRSTLVLLICSDAGDHLGLNLDRFTVEELTFMATPVAV